MEGARGRQPGTLGRLRRRLRLVRRGLRARTASRTARLRDSTQYSYYYSYMNTVSSAARWVRNHVDVPRDSYVPALRVPDGSDYVL